MLMRNTLAAAERQVRLGKQASRVLPLGITPPPLGDANRPVATAG
jgi:hypothetical protein